MGYNVGFQAKWPSSRQGDEQPLPAGCHTAILQQQPPGGLAFAHSFENESLVSSDLLPYSFATCNLRPIASRSSALNEKY